MNVPESTVTFPPAHSIDYEAVLATALVESGKNLALFLHQHLPSKWRDVYATAARRPTNIVGLRSGTFEYLYDLYSELEATGEIPYDQTAEDRIVAVFGRSAPPTDPMGDQSRTRGWLETTDSLLGANRDRGHFIARSIGGGAHVNVFSQDRELNRGWSTRGKIYRQMERYCQEYPGAFCFSRPVYTDSSSVPRWVEFGVLREDATLWIEAFDNMP